MENTLQQALNVKLLEKAMTKAIKTNEEAEKRWNAVLKGYKTALEGLKIFPKDLKTNCLVPLSKRAMILGQLIHTNEIMVRLGGEYFAKFSAARAIEYCKRQIENTEQHLKDLQVERGLYETRLLSLDNLVLEEGCELTEHWTEDQLNDWRAQHRAKQKEYHEKLAKERANREDAENKRETTNAEDEELFNRLDELEIMESFKDELNRSDIGYSDSESDSDESGTETSDEDALQILEEERSRLQNIREQSSEKAEQSTKSIPKKSISFSANLEERSDGRKPEQKTKEEGEEVDDENESPLRIEFSHSSVEPQRSQVEADEIQSPVDIYRIFSKPKSILKKTNDVIPVDKSLLNPSKIEEEEEEAEEEENAPEGSTYEIVVKDVTEKKTEDVLSSKPTAEEAGARPVSKFKRERLSKK